MRKRDTAPPRKTAREKIADSLDLSKEILLNTSKIEVIGNREITIENYQGICEYSPNCICLLSSPTNIKICGENLEIKTMTKDFLYAMGTITSVSFCDMGREKL